MLRFVVLYCVLCVVCCVVCCIVLYCVVLYSSLMSSLSPSHVSCRAVAHARVPQSVAGGNTKFQVALLTVSPSTPAPGGVGHHVPDEDLKIVVVTQHKHLFRCGVCHG